MSWKTGVLLLLSLDEIWSYEDEDIVESEALNNVNAWLNEKDYGNLVDLADAISKESNPILAVVYGGSFNRLDEEEFFNVVASQNWKSRRNVQLLMKGTGDERFTLHTLRKKRQATK